MEQLGEVHARKQRDMMRDSVAMAVANGHASRLFG
jgi:hypothetical protein